MDRGLAVALTAFAGGLVALQAPVNSGLGKTIGTTQGAFLSFLIGTVALAIVAGFTGGFGGLGRVADVPGWQYLTGGLLGAVYVTTILVTVRTLGAGGLVAATIAGQLAMSVVIDQLGLLGVAKDPVNAGKLLGIALLGAGVLLVVRS